MYSSSALPVQELRLGVPFPGIILSPVGKACVSCQDKELIAAKGLAVVDCSWNRLEDVPFGDLAYSTPCSTLLSTLLGPSMQRKKPYCLMPVHLHLHDKHTMVTVVAQHSPVVLRGLPCGQRRRPHQGARAAAAALAAGGQPCELRSSLQALLRRGFCRRALHLRVAARGLQRALPLQVVTCCPTSLSPHRMIAMSGSGSITVSAVLRTHGAGACMQQQPCFPSSCSAPLGGARSGGPSCLLRQFPPLCRGHGFFSANEELLERYAACPGSAEVIAVQSAHLEALRAPPPAPPAGMPFCQTATLGWEKAPSPCLLPSLCALLCPAPGDRAGRGAVPLVTKGVLHWRRGSLHAVCDCSRGSCPGTRGNDYMADVDLPPSSSGSEASDEEPDQRDRSVRAGTSDSPVTVCSDCLDHGRVMLSGTTTGAPDETSCQLCPG